MIKWAVGIVAVLIVIGIATGGSKSDLEAKPEDRKYSSIGDLKTAVDKAGYKCPSWGKATDSSDLSGGLWTRECSNGDLITWTSGAYARKAEGIMKAPCSDVVELNGLNWSFWSDRAPEYADALGGRLCGP